jgi:tetratricopeptide (TPR) repeat protein
MVHIDMNEELLRRIGAIEKNARSDENALNEANELVRDFPQCAEAWRTLAYIESLSKNREEAIRYITRAIEIDPDQPFYLYTRALYRSKSLDFHGAVKDAKLGIAISDRLQFHYYRDSLLFLSAHAHVQLGDIDVARGELFSIEDREVRTWIHGLVTWESLAERCGIDRPL